jgi:hypothetical protein
MPFVQAGDVRLCYENFGGMCRFFSNWGPGAGSTVEAFTRRGLSPAVTKSSFTITAVSKSSINRTFVKNNKKLDKGLSYRLSVG